MDECELDDELADMGSGDMDDTDDDGGGSIDEECA